MPSSRTLTSSPVTHSSLARRRSHQDTVLSSLKLNLSTLTSLPAWASLPTPPMSGTPPPGPSLDPPQYAGKRRKREDSPPSTTQAASSAAFAPVGISPLRQTPGQYAGPARPQRPLETSVMPSPIQMPWDQPTSFAMGGGMTSNFAAQYGPPLTSLRQPPPASPRNTRKTKAHVASACVNCKKKHLRCDEERPCRRCVQSGKEGTCVDVTHKKRGRPPLKPDDGHGSRIVGRPMLPPLGLARGPTGPSLPPLLPSPNTNLGFPSYAQPTIAQSMTVAAGQFANPPRPSFPNIAQQPPSQPQTSGYSYPPHMSAFHSYPQYQAPIMPHANAQQYPAALFPRQTTGPPSMLPTGYTPQGLLLPPILPAPARATLDPAYAQPPGPTIQATRLSNVQQRSYQQQGSYPGPAETDEPDPKRPRMDIQGILHPRQ